MSFNTHNIYHPLIVNSGWTSQSVSATTVSAGTFYGGSLSATYVGNQNVTNQEFRYVSGLTSNTQTQINNLVNRTERLLTFQSDDFLTNDRVISSGNNINFESTNSHLGISASFPSIEVSAITTVLTSAQSAITNFNPTNWQINNTTVATHIVFSGTESSIISGLVGGSNGKMVILTNYSTGLIILENKSSKTQYSNRFNFSSQGAYFLVRNRTITLIYDQEKGWTNFFPINQNKDFEIFSDFTNVLDLRVYSSATPPSIGVNGYFTYPPFSGQYTTSNAFPTISGSNDSNGILVIPANSPSNVNQGSCYGANRGCNGNTYSCLITKCKINDFYDYTGYTSENECIQITNNATLKNGVATEMLGTQYMGWTTPITSATFTNVTNWYLRWNNSSTKVYSVSSVPLSSTTNNWVYFGTYYGTGSNGSFFYSFNNQEYTWELILKSGLAVNAAGLIGVISRTNKSSVSPKLFVDWFGINIGS
jgi:hypothetical protein